MDKNRLTIPKEAFDDLGLVHYVAVQTQLVMGKEQQMLD